MIEGTRTRREMENNTIPHVVHGHGGRCVRAMLVHKHTPWLHHSSNICTQKCRVFGQNKKWGRHLRSAIFKQRGGQGKRNFLPSTVTLTAPQ